MLQPCVHDFRTLMNVTFLLKIMLYELRHLFCSASIGCTLSGCAAVLYVAHRKRYRTFVDANKKGQMNGLHSKNSFIHVFLSVCLGIHNAV